MNNKSEVPISMKSIMQELSRGPRTAEELEDNFRGNPRIHQEMDALLKKGFIRWGGFSRTKGRGDEEVHYRGYRLTSSGEREMSKSQEHSRNKSVELSR